MMNGARRSSRLMHPDGCRCLACLFDAGHRPRHVCVCIIMPGLPAGISADTFQTLWAIRDLYQGLGVGLNVVPVQGLSYEHALAEVAARAVQWSSAEDFFFLDTDIAFDAQWLALMGLLEQPIVCGTYEQRTAPGEWCLNTTDPGAFSAEVSFDPLTGARLLPINDTGFGAVRLRREVLETMAAAHPELSYWSMNNDLKAPAFGLWDPFVFEHGGVRRRCAGDTNFFKRARDCGFQPWALTQMPINHARMGVKSLDQWVAARQTSLELAASQGAKLGPECDACHERQLEPLITVEGDGTPGGDAHLCKRCAMQRPTEGQVAPWQSPKA